MSLPLLHLPEVWNWGGLSFREIASRTCIAIDKHETIDRAAIVAFYAMLALVPFLGLVVSFTLGASDGAVAREILGLSRQFLPEAADAVVRKELETIRRSPRVGIVSVSFLILVWSTSSAFVAVMDSTNASYGVRDGRAWWKRRLMAAVLTVIETLLLVGASITIAAWPWMMNEFALDGTASVAATTIQWLVVIVALQAGFAIAYSFATQVERTRAWITPGSIVGVLALIAVNLGLRVYLRYGPDIGATYGALAGVILLLLWLYAAALALLVGAEINCVIQRAAPPVTVSTQKDA